MVNNKRLLNEAEIWKLLGTIPDPDIPVISITDLGLIKQVEVKEEGNIIVTITPSYSGCPAIGVFKDEIQQVLMKSGAKHVEIKVSYSPAWTTDWLSENTREKLKQYGIAPPEKSCDTVTRLFSDSMKKIACPHCMQNNTQLLSQFGSTPCKSIWYCNTCSQPFEYFKCH